MSFLESIQHGLEKVSQEAEHLAKVQHLHSSANDLTSKCSQESQALVAKALEMYQRSQLPKSDLTAICQQLLTYQQQLNEVHAELQRLQGSQQAGAAAVPAQPVMPAPVAPAAPAVHPVAASHVAPAKAPSEHSAPHHAPASEAPPHASPRPKAKDDDDEPAAPAKRASASTKSAGDAKTQTKAASGSYQDGVLPPIYSPFTKPAAAKAEDDAPVAAQRATRKAADDDDAPAKDKKPRKAADDDAPAKDKKPRKTSDS